MEGTPQHGSLDDTKPDINICSKWGGMIVTEHNLQHGWRNVSDDQKKLPHARVLRCFKCEANGKQHLLGVIAPFGDMAKCNAASTAGAGANAIWCHGFVAGYLQDPFSWWSVKVAADWTVVSAEIGPITFLTAPNPSKAASQ